MNTLKQRGKWKTALLDQDYLAIPQVVSEMNMVVKME